MKIDRLIGILSVLLQRDKATSAELAERFEVSRRTILRDIDTLNMAGIPVVSGQGKGGGISIMSGYRIDRTLLSSDDMQAILSGLCSLDSVSGTSRYRQLMEKLSAGGAASVNADNRIIIDLSSWDRSRVSEKIELIKGAMGKRRIIAFRYFSPNGESLRRTEPYRLIFQWSSWYVWGYCTERRDYRLFKLSRMTELTVTEEEFAERAVPEYEQEKLMRSESEIRVRVRFDESVRWRLTDELGADRVDCGKDGSIETELTWSDKESFFRWLLTFGSSAEITKPEDLRRDFSELVKKISALYGI